MLFRVTFTAVVFFLLAAALVQLRRGEEVPPPPAFAAPGTKEVFERLEFPRGAHSLRGRVLGADGLAASGVLVELRAGLEPRWDFTDDAGAFALDELPAGEVVVVLVRPGHMPVSERVVLPRAEPLVLRLPLPEPALPSLPPIEEAPLAGRLLPALDEDLTGYEAVLRPTEENDPFAGATLQRTTVDAEGRFAFERVGHGQYVLEVLPPWAAGGSWPVLAEHRIDHPTPESQERIRLRAGAFAGMLRDDVLAPVHGALLRLTPENRTDRVWPPVLTAEDGTYRIADLPPGRYRLSVRAGGHSAERTIELSAWQTIDPGLRLTAP